MAVDAYSHTLFNPLDAQAQFGKKSLPDQLMWYRMCWSFCRHVGIPLAMPLPSVRDIPRYR